MEKHFVNEAKKYCSDIEKLFITIVTALSMIATLGIVLFILTGFGLSIIFISVILIFMFVSKRALYVSLLINVSNDIKTNNISTTVGKAISCSKDKNYSKLSWKNKSKLNAGDRFVLTLEGDKIFKMTKHFNLKRFVEPTVKITYLTNSRVVLKLEVLDVEEQLEDFAEGEIKNKEVFTDNRMMLNFFDGKIRFPVVMAVSKDDIMNKVYINAYYESILDYDAEMYNEIIDEESMDDTDEGNDDSRKASVLMRKVVDGIKGYVATTNSAKLKDTKKIKEIVSNAITSVYKEFDVRDVKIYIKRQ